MFRYIKTITLKNNEEGYRNIKCFINDTDGKEYRYNLMYKLYCSSQGDLYDDDENRIETYLTKAAKNGRQYIAFNHLGYNRVYLHRIVAYLFVEGYNKDLVVDHKDNNSLNDDATNLQYIEQRDNIIKECGEKTVVTNIYTREIIEFNSKADFFKYFNISSTSISMMIRRYQEMNIDLTTFLEQYSKELSLLYLDYV